MNVLVHVYKQNVKTGKSNISKTHISSVRSKARNLQQTDLASTCSETL
jgi:hypothetical protein